MIGSKSKKTKGWFFVKVELVRVKLGIVAFAFGVGKGFDGKEIIPNQRIAGAAMQIAKSTGAPIYTQSDIPIDPCFDVRYAIQEKKDSPPSTLRIVMEALEWARGRKIEEIEVVAAMPHMRRCIRDIELGAKELGLRIRVHQNTLVGMYHYESWFDQFSTQWWTRTQLGWRIREGITWLLPWEIYRIVAS